MSERRKELRKKVMVFTPVRDVKHGTLLGYLGDLTLLGAQVIGEKPLEPSAQLTLVIELPGDIPDISAQTLTLPARVARCVPDKETPREFNIGFEFLETLPEQAQVIRALLERYFFRYQSEE